MRDATNLLRPDQPIAVKAKNQDPLEESYLLNWIRWKGLHHVGDFYVSGTEDRGSPGGPG